MTLLVGKILAALAALTIALSALVAMQVQDLSFGSAPSGLASTVSTSSSQTLVANVVSAIAATSTNCASRIISTDAGDTHLTFRSADTPTEATGILQLASTTVAYDSGIYGCGLIKAFSELGAEIDVLETR